MPVPFNKFQNAVEDILKGVHDFSADNINIALTNTAPSATDLILSSISQIINGGGYTQGGYLLVNRALTEVTGTAKFDADDLTITATGAAIAEWQYAVIYNATAVGGPLLGWYDYNAKLNLAQDESVTVRLDAANGMFSLA